MFLPVSRVVLIMVGIVLIGACATAEPPRFLPPQDRPPLEKETPWPKNGFLVLAYHDVEDGAADQRYLSVRTSALNEQMAWLRDNDYQPVSVQQILDAHNGGKALPAKAVLLSFDDGFSSFYTRVWPLLKAYDWPALWAPVGSWVDTPLDEPVDFGGLMSARDRFATWDMVRELSSSPLVEIGAHTWNAHFGALGNPQGSALPAIANRGYDERTGRYESDREFQQRIDNDIKVITAKLREHTGMAPRAWVWPYGAENGTTLSIAQKHGYQLAFTLEDGLANAADLSSIPRMLISGNPSIHEFSNAVSRVREISPMRVMHIDLDYVYDPDPGQQKRNVDTLIQRVHDMKISHVFLQAFADPEGDGNVKALYFPNRWLPMRADLFNFISWQLRNRAEVKVYAWMPVLAFDLDAAIPRVQTLRPGTGTGSVEPDQYARLSPWNDEARRRITEIYQDLARHASFQGVLFHDDALLSDFEDAGPDAMAAYRSAGFQGTIADIRKNPEEFRRWTRFKSASLVAFTRSLAQAVRDIRGPQVKTARNIYAMPVLEPESEAWFSQNFDDFLAAYDWVAPMAMPLMEGVSIEKSNEWLDRLVQAVMRHPGARDKTIFELQALDWRGEQGHRQISAAKLAEWMTRLQLNGVRHYGYYPDDFINDQPEMSGVRPAFSSYWYPEND
ncbi:Biofilm PGA synthesis deacetylase PgaB (EC 3.-) [Alloalcanivorax xenomutans]|uniref:poly-beta-1,6-N-acetyl-D-glucosamine N-deacetylase PgaB n=1 Tax=Alloalcanivorax xenomutans TaxID=1094342 RepID=UPI0006D5C2F0|nr:poly-beta-1,6-N-acetyl-D-glucosamine N-deacetylase PgaB [Alloalcanivorax xenomutans]CUR46267.1 Biofilm PGA synthesis deacetylase PgaB (EC 3.-) [Alloalcanivorax xenomutans]